MLDSFSSFFNSFEVVLFHDLEHEIKVKKYFFFIHLFTTGPDKVAPSHFCFLKNSSNCQIDLSFLVTSHIGKTWVLIRSILLFISSSALWRGKVRPRGDFFHFSSLTIYSVNDCIRQSYS